jgi:hypothetical protein
MKIDGYASHLPILAWAAQHYNRDDGPPIEIGSGFYSTALIQSLGGQSIETEEAWADHVRHWYPGVQTVAQWVQRERYGFAFIDSAEHELRLEWVRLLAGKTDLIIVHDAEPVWWEPMGYDQMIKCMPHHQVYKSTKPWTLILSRHDLGQILEPATPPELR